MSKRKVSGLVIYPLMLKGFGISAMLLSFIMGIAGVFGAGVVKFNNEVITGLAALPVSLLIGVIMTLIFTAIFGTMTFIGLWLYSKVRALSVSVIEP
ncbi:hypothetical protein [Pantoea sp. 1.19]|uniref:hypothetical protein n=1 Tax=Pantoea sp. 1.19 TaxID=1925589 RepID=UPI000948E56D|nr:hypothetical protein [Pantoea sp. 1.19]